MNKIQKGFTLIELMIVIAIIGVLAAIAIPSYQDYVGRAQVSEAVTILASYKTGLTEYFDLNGSFAAITNIADIGVAQGGNYVSTVAVVAGATGGTVAIQATMRAAGINAQLTNQTLGMGTYDGGGTWECGNSLPGNANTDPVATATSIPDGFLPGSCR